MNVEQRQNELNRLYRNFLASIKFSEDQPDEYRSYDLKFGDHYGDEGLLMTLFSRDQLDALIEYLIRTVQGVSSKSADEQCRILAQELFRKAFDSNLIRQEDLRTETPLSGIDEGAIAKEVALIPTKLRSEVHPRRQLILISEITLDFPELKIGDVTIYRADSGPLPEHFKQIDDDDRWYSFKKLQEELQHDMSILPMSYAVVDIEGDFYFAKQEALRKFQSAAHILNFLLGFAGAKYSEGRFKKIRFRGTEGRLFQDVYEIPTETTRETSFRIGVSSSTYGVMPYQISHYMLKGRERSVSFVAQCFDKESTDLRGRIRRAVTWFSNGVNGDSSEEQFVSFMIALESLLVGDEGKNDTATQGSISQVLRDRVCLLVGVDFSHRMVLQTEVRQLYKLRSSIVHNGALATQKQVSELELIVRSAILVILERFSLGSWADFLEWERVQKFSHTQLPSFHENIVDTNNK